MAKKKKAAGPTWTEKVEVAVREAIARIPGLDAIDELSYCEAVLEGVELYTAGIQMRKEELEAEAE